jgi:hypothetical protein
MTVRERDRLDLVVAGGEVAVPEQGQFLAERVGPADNAIEPADLERSKKATWRMASSVVNWRDESRRDPPYDSWRLRLFDQDIAQVPCLAWLDDELLADALAPPWV